ELVIGDVPTLGESRLHRQVVSRLDQRVVHVLEDLEAGVGRGQVRIQSVRFGSLRRDERAASGACFSFVGRLRASDVVWAVVSSGGEVVPGSPTSTLSPCWQAARTIAMTTMKVIVLSNPRDLIPVSFLLQKLGGVTAPTTVASLSVSFAHQWGMDGS